MKIRVSLELPLGGVRDVVLSFDVTATVCDAARALVRAGLSGEHDVERIAEGRLGHVTLRGAPGGTGAPVLLDPGSLIVASGLQAGWSIRPVLEFSDRGETARRLIETAGVVEVLSGVHRGATFSLLPGPNLIGRNRECRVHLSDASVSRRHVALEVRKIQQGASNSTLSAPGPSGSTEIMLHDLGSANGMTVDGVRVSERQLTVPGTVDLGGVSLRLVPGTFPVQSPDFAHRTVHTRSPRVEPRFPSGERELPAPPEPTAPNRIPMLAMLAPMMLGGVMYALTGSPMSLVMVAFSPLMMIGSWLDGRVGAARRQRRETVRFASVLDAEAAELRELRDVEIEARTVETPGLLEIETAIATRNTLLWARRPSIARFSNSGSGTGRSPAARHCGFRLALMPHASSGLRSAPWRALSVISLLFR